MSHAKIFLAIALISTPAVVAAPLSFEDRVEAQRAIEQVYWSHRIWPKENPGPKPPLSSVMTDDMLRTRVEDYLKKSNALETIWHHPITTRDLQAELNRMAAQSRDPETLAELFDALDIDRGALGSRRIAETLARQTLVDRLIRNWYGSDVRFHAAARAKAEAAWALCSTAGCMRSMGGEYRETTFRARKDAGGEAEDRPSPGTVDLDRDEWSDRLSTLGSLLSASRDALPISRLSSVEETPEAFVVTAVLSQRGDRITTASVSWPKTPFDDWWAAERGAFDANVNPTREPYAKPVIALAACAPDTWQATVNDRLEPRFNHTAIWTGSEMIIWGGTGGDFFNSGARYNPSTDSWIATSIGTNCPTPRSSHTAVWTGTEMIVWGGLRLSTYLNTGGRYDPTSNTWTATSTGATEPAPRGTHTAVWTGTEMIVWGGWNGSLGQAYNTGGRYTPSTNSWLATPATNVPEARYSHTAIWSGTQMIVWGGHSEVAPLNSGGRYTPGAAGWTPTSLTNAPSARNGHSGIWTGSHMLVWGGRDGVQSYDTGGRYTPSTNSWIATSTGANVPEPRESHTAIWTGTEMIVWGGSYGDSRLNSGGRFNPSTNVWSTVSTGANVPTGRYLMTALWTGSQMVVWGGLTDAGASNTGSRYSPSTNSWTPMSSGTIPSPRSGHRAVWTGAEMIVFGGNDSTGGRYAPSTDTWLPTSTGANVPSGSSAYCAVWTGTEMIVWGSGSFFLLNTGARYNPTADTWSPTSTGSNVPTPRNFPTAVWTGTEMIVWGGGGPPNAQNPGGAPLNTGGRYHPGSNSWVPTSTGTNVPSSRFEHSAVWTGTEMIVWGGGVSGGSTTNTGGRYDPTTDSWIPVSTGAAVPSARSLHSAVWTGEQMVVWSGIIGSSYPTSGGRYSPATDSWLTTSTVGSPTGRIRNSTVWTGFEMIVWGGGGPGSVNTGGKYDPSSDSWIPTSAGGSVPFARFSHSGVWTGTQMIVWGGEPGPTSTGGLYCVGSCATPNTYYQDGDGDGHGTSSVTVSACSNPPNYATTADDCDDTDPGIFPGAPELCNGRDDNCDDVTDNAVVPAGVPALDVSQSSPSVASLAWTAVADATAYDVVRGDLTTLTSSGGDFTTAVQACLTPDVVGTSVDDATVPDPEQTFWYLVRPRSCGGNGTYDGGSPQQFGTRDTINASPNACP